MGVYRRKDSPYWWLWLEPTRERLSTGIPIGLTITQKKDSRAQALELYHTEMLKRTARVHRLPSARSPIVFSAYAEMYLRDVIVHHKGAERERELLRALLAAFGQEPLALIDQDRVRSYMRDRRQTISASTINREIDLLKAMCRTAVPRYLDSSPLVGMKRLPSPRRTRRILQPDEEARLLAVATHPQDYAILVLGIDTLIRLGDLLDLHRTDRHDGWLTVRDPKGGDPYDVPLSPRAAAALDGIGHDKPYYFHKFRRAESRRDWASSVRQRLERLCKLAAPPVPYGHLTGITFHGATRKTGATRMLVGRGVPLAIVQRLGGWKSPEVLLRHYVDVDRDALLAAVGQEKRRA